MWSRRSRSPSHPLAKKYLGEDKYPYLGAGEQRVIIQLRPERIDGYGARG
jgi:hypothetical protein